jgi:hypothetical protein
MPNSELPLYSSDIIDRSIETIRRSYELIAQTTELLEQSRKMLGLVPQDHKSTHCEP